MRRWWSADELVERWSLTPEDLSLLVGRIDAGKLGLAAQLAYWRRYGAFPDEETDLAPAVIAHLAAQVGVGAGALDSYDWSGRTGRRHRQAILNHLAITNFDDKAEAALRRWLAEEVLQREPNAATLEDEIGAWFARRRIVRPGAYRLDRIEHSARAVHDDDVLRTVADRLDPEVDQRLDGLLADDGTRAAFTRLAADPGRVGLESLLAEIDKLNVVRALALPADLLRGVHADLVKRFRRRAAVETAWELRRHPERTRLPLLAFYCLPREAENVDGLVELLIQVTHRITVKAEKRVVEELLADAVQVRGKIGILFNVARAALDKPDGVVREVIFPVAGEQTFEKLVKEAAAGAGQRHAHPHRGPRLLRLLLSADAAEAARRDRVPLEQRDASSAPRRYRGDPRCRRRRAAILRTRRDRGRRRHPAKVARHRHRGRARWDQARQPHQLRDLRAPVAAREAPLQGGVERRECQKPGAS